MAKIETNIIIIISFNNSDKGAVIHAIVRRVLWEYRSAVNHLSDEIESERLRREMFDRYEEWLCMKILH